MSLRQLLTYAHEDASFEAFADAARSEPQRAFVSASLRPYLLASLLDADPSRPALVVAGDDRSARDLAADLKAFLSPRPVRLYPARGVRYESHLAPPPHLVGLRIAALDALRELEGAVVVASSPRSARRCPIRRCGRTVFEIAKGELLDLDEVTERLVACGYERVDQVEDRGQFALRGDILDVYPATEERAVRCELFDIEGRAAHLLLDVHAAFARRSRACRDRTRRGARARAPRARRDRGHRGEEDRPDVAELLPLDRFGEMLGLVPENAFVAVAAEEELAPSLADHWQDITTSFHDADAHQLYVSPEELEPELDRRAAVRLSSIRATQPHNVPRAVGRHRCEIAARGRA
jgi:transcription-repair coupling factor (superfamily II helicase)